MENTLVLTLEKAHNIGMRYKKTISSTDLAQTYYIQDEALKNAINIHNVVIPYNVQYIGEMAFMGCINLTNLDILSYNIVIAESAFQNCYQLKTLVLDTSKIGEMAFKNCVNLEYIKISGTLKKIQRSMFKYCVKLQKIVANDVECIAQKAFYQCETLPSLKTLANIKYISSMAFHACNLVTIDLDHLFYIGAYAFKDCKNITSVKLRGKVDCVKFSTFQGCIKLKQIKLPHVTKIEEFAFLDCCSLVFVELPNIKYIYEHAFENCIMLEKFILPKKINVEKRAFYNCHQLKTLNIEDIEYIDVQAFEGCNIKLIISNLSQNKIINKKFLFNCYLINHYKYHQLKKELITKTKDTLADNVLGSLKNITNYHFIMQNIMDLLDLHELVRLKMLTNNSVQTVEPCKKSIFFCYNFREKPITYYIKTIKQSKNNKLLATNIQELKC